MIAIKRIRTIRNNKLVVQMPERYNNSRVEVIVLPIDDKPSINIFDLAGKISDIDFADLKGILSGINTNIEREGDRL